MGKQSPRNRHQQGRAAGTAAPQPVATLFQQALALHQQEKLDQAAAIYKQILRGQPAHPDALLFLGHLHLQRGQAPLAAEVLGKAVAVNPQHPVAQFNLGTALFRMLRYADAIARFDAAIRLKPDYAEAFNNRGSAQQNLDRHEDAIASFNRAIALRPDDDFAHNNRGISQQRLGQHAEAIASFDQAIRLNPRNGVARNNRGISLLYQGAPDEAAEEFRRARELQPDYFDACINHGIALSCLGRHAEALESIDRALALRPDNGLVHNNRGMALMHLGRYAEAVASFERCLERIPNYFEALNNLGLALPYLGRQPEALARFRQALAVQPDNATAHYNLGMCLLQTGQYAAGWPEFEWRWQTGQYAVAKRDLAPPLWLGRETLHGRTILLHAEQGLGDTLQFCRYATQLAAHGATVLLEAQPALKSLLGTLDGVSRVIAQGEALPAFDYHCPLLSLPLACATDLANIPAAPRYLAADADRRTAWRARLGERTRPRIGLAWAGNTAFGNDHNRSIALADFADLKPGNFGLVSLQKEIRPSDQAAFAARSDIVHFGEELHDFADTAALIDELDLVISVDTAVAHLAGALGKPVWLLLPYNPDWRWLLERNDSPWYPSARLFRQAQPGDWHGVIARLADELAALR